MATCLEFLTRTMQTQSVFANASRSRSFSVLAAVLFGVCLLAEGIYCFLRPIASFDTLAYVSIAEGGGNVFSQAGRDCFSQLPGKHTECDETTSSTMFTDVTHYTPADFAIFLRFYQNKPLFTLVSIGLHRRLGLSAFTALRVISSTCFVLTGVVLWVWLKEHLSFTAASLVALFLVSSPSVLNLGKNLVPDVLSTFLLLLSIYLLLYKRPRWPGIAVLVLLPLARPDNIIFVAFFAGALIYRAQDSVQLRWTQLMLLGLGCLLMTTVLAKATHALPYPVLFERSFIAWINPVSFAGIHVTLGQYLHVLSSNGVRTILFCLPVAAFLATIALADAGSWQPLRSLVLAAIATLMVRILLFPGVEERYYVWFYLICAIAASAVVAQLANKERSWFVKARPEDEARQPAGILQQA